MQILTFSWKLVEEVSGRVVSSGLSAIAGATGRSWGIGTNPTSKQIQNLQESLEVLEHSLDVHGGPFGVNLEASVAFETSSSSEYEGIKKLFEEKEGEITIARAKCYLDVVNLKEGYRPKYDRGFIRFLESINDTKDR